MAKRFTGEKYKHFNRYGAKFLYAFFSLLGAIPRRHARSTADVIGRIWFALDRPHRKVALDNLKTAFGDEKNEAERRQIAKTAFGNIAMIPFEIGWSLGLEMDEILGHCRIEGLEHIRAAHAKGKGVLVLGLHLGNWELLPAISSSFGYQINMIYRPLDFTPADIFFLNYRRRFGGRPIAKKKSMRKLISALREKACVGILLDQDPRRAAGIFVDFFGKPTCTNKGMAQLAMKTRAPVLPIFSARQGTEFVAYIGPEIPLIDTGHKESDLHKNTEAYNMALERIIRQYPDQWLWMHKRWKTRLIPRTPPPQ